MTKKYPLEDMIILVLGISWGDKAGSAGFGTVQARLSGSYSKRMSGGRGTSNYLVFGADLGLSQRRINIAKLRWGTQHDGNGGFDEWIKFRRNQI